METKVKKAPRMRKAYRLLMVVGLVGVMMCMMVIPAAAAGEMATVISAIDDVVSVVGTVFTAIIGNPLLVFFLAVSLLGAGIGIFMGLKNAAR